MSEPLLLNFPSVLQYGDHIEFKGVAGEKWFNVDLLSQYWAIDPVQSDLFTDMDGELPLTQTQPLQILFDLECGWDVNANSPETSSCSHGSSLKRFGFCAGQPFSCKIVICKEFFEVYLNEIQLASSEHLVPVGSIYALRLSGDSMVESIYYGHPIAIKKAMTKSKPRDLTPIECRLTFDDITDDEDDGHVMREFDEYKTQTAVPMSRSVNDLYWVKHKKLSPGRSTYDSLTRLNRASSYQLVFDSEESEREETSRTTNNNNQSTMHENEYQHTNKMLLLDNHEFPFDQPNSWIRHERYGEGERKFNVHNSRRRTSSLARKARSTREARSLIKKQYRCDGTIVTQDSQENANSLKHRSHSLQNDDQPNQEASLDDIPSLIYEADCTNKYSRNHYNDSSISFVKNKQPINNVGTGNKQQLPEKRKPHIRRPISALDGLWDAVLPKATITCEELQRLPVRLKNSDKNQTLNGSKSLHAFSDTECDQTREEDEVVYRYINDTGDHNNIGNKQAGWMGHPTGAAHGPKTSNEDSLIANTSCSEQLHTYEEEFSELSEEINEYLSSPTPINPRVCSTDKLTEHRSTKLSPPVLLIDTQDMETNNFTQKTEQESLWPNVRNERNNLAEETKTELCDTLRSLDIVREYGDDDGIRRLLRAQHNQKLFPSSLPSRKLPIKGFPPENNIPAISNGKRSPEHPSIETRKGVECCEAKAIETGGSKSQYIREPNMSNGDVKFNRTPECQPVKQSSTFQDTAKQPSAKMNGVRTFVNAPRHWLTRKLSSYRKHNAPIQPNPMPVLVNASNSNV